MKWKPLLIGSIVIILLLVFPVQAVNTPVVSSPDEPGPYHIGYYRVSYNVPPFGWYRAKIRNSLRPEIFRMVRCTDIFITIRPLKLCAVRVCTRRLDTKIILIGSGPSCSFFMAAAVPMNHGSVLVMPTSYSII